MNQVILIKMWKLVKNMEINDAYTETITRQVGAMMLMKLAMFSMVYLTQKYAKDSAVAAGVIGALAGAFMGLAFALNATAGAMASASTGGKDMGAFFANL